MLHSGQRIGEYVLQRRVGSGGFGEVWLAVHNAWPDRRAAVKVPVDASVIRSLQREGAAVAGLSHPNIVKALNFDPFGDPPYLVFEFVPGQNLREVLADGPLSLEVAVIVLRQVLEGLSYAHRKGVIHRDVKPENILIHEKGLKEGLRSGTVKVSDFGLSRGTTDRVSNSIQLSAEVSTEATVAGTLAYMAPEQREGRPCDARADLYACGLILFEMLTGRRPGGLEYPSGSCPDLSQWVDRVYAKACAPLDQRYASAEEFITDIQRELATPARGSATPPPLPRGYLAAATQAPIEQLAADIQYLNTWGNGPSGSPTRRRNQSSPAVLIAAGGIALLVLVVGLRALSGRETKPTISRGDSATADKDVSPSLQERGQSSGSSPYKVERTPLMNPSQEYSPRWDEPKSPIAKPIIAAPPSPPLPSSVMPSPRPAESPRINQPAVPVPSDAVHTTTEPRTTAPPPVTQLTTLPVTGLRPATQPVPAAVSTGSPSSQPTFVELELRPSKHAVRGQWSLDKGGVISNIGSVVERAQLNLPIRTGDVYELIVEFERTSGEGGPFFLLPVGGDRTVMLSMEGDSPRCAGISKINGLDAPKNPSRVLGTIRNGTRYSLRIRTSIVGDTARIASTLNSRPFVTWIGNVNELSEPDYFPTPPPRVPALATWSNSVIFHSVKILNTEPPPPIARQANRPLSRTVYFIDLSSSMAPSMKRAAEQALTSITSLTPSQSFGVVVARDGKCLSLDTKLLPATEAHKARARVFLEEIKAGSSVGSWSEAVKEVAKLAPDAVWVATDGNRRDTSIAAITEFRRAAKAGKFVVNTTTDFSGSAPTRDQMDFIWRLAHNTGGICRDSAGAEVQELPN